MPSRPSNRDGRCPAPPPPDRIDRSPVPPPGSPRARSPRSPNRSRAAGLRFVALPLPPRPVHVAHLQRTRVRRGHLPRTGEDRGRNRVLSLATATERARTGSSGEGLLMTTSRNLRAPVLGRVEQHKLLW